MLNNNEKFITKSKLSNIIGESNYIYKNTKYVSTYLKNILDDCSNDNLDNDMLDILHSIEYLLIEYNKL